MDIQKFTDIQINAMKTILNTAIDKSELNKYFLFTQKPIEKAKVFIFCNRFLVTLYNLVEDTTLKTIIKDISKDTQKIADDVAINLDKYQNGGELRKYYINRQIYMLVSNEKVNEIIDLFALLTDKVSYLQISKLKGIVMEGKSGEMAKKVFSEV